MSFPKAKLKRFNDISTAVNSPCYEKKEKASKILGAFLAGKEERFNERCVDKIEKPDKPEKPKSHSSEKDPAKSSKYRLFRTPSLPRRLRFRNTESTPSKSSIKAAALAAAELAEQTAKVDALKEKEAFEAALIEIKNKTETLHENETIIEELKTTTYTLNETLSKLNTEIVEKNSRIAHLEREIDSLNQADEMIKNIAENSLDKIKQLNDEIANINKCREIEVLNLTKVRSELEDDLEACKKELKLSQDMNINLKNRNDDLVDENKSLKAQIAESQSKFGQIESENKTLQSKVDELREECDNDMIAYIEETKNLFIEIDNLKKINETLSIELGNEKTLVKNLRNDILNLKAVNDMLAKKFDSQLLTMNEMHDMKIKELESIHYLEKSKLQKEYRENVEELKSLHNVELATINETSEEKIKISEIQIEEKIKALEASLECSIDQERKQFKAELDKCQKIAEHEIIKCEYEKNDLKELLEIANELVRDKDHQIEELESRLKSRYENEANSHDSCRVELEEARQECKRIMTEKYNYQLTLNNTRSTVNILIERLKKSDSDVEIFKNEIETVTTIKKDLEFRCEKLQEELILLKTELDEYKVALSALHQSSSAIEYVMKQENLAEKLKLSEEETAQTMEHINQLFDLKIEENIKKYFDMYNELKKKYEIRETYIKDMKLLLDEFVTGIEIARIEIETKNTKLAELEQENKDIKLENMTYKFKCEQFERYDHPDSLRKQTNTPEVQDTSDNEIISNILIENIINDLDNSLNEKSQKGMLSMRCNQTFCITTDDSSECKVDSLEFKHKVQELEDKLRKTEQLLVNSQKHKSTDSLKEANYMLQSKINELNSINKDQETKIHELNEKIVKLDDNRTPKKIKPLKAQGNGTPKTPKTPIKTFAGKENLSPAVSVTNVSSPKGVLRPRNN